MVYHEPKVMAEIGCNHMGDLDIAKELLTLAKNCGCEYGKFQKRCPKLLTKEQSRRPTPTLATLTATRTVLTARTELTVDRTVSSRSTATKSASATRAQCGSTPAKEIVSLNPDLIKASSPSNQHWEMQKVCAMSTLETSTSPPA